jgi:hypothetical protein
MSSILPARNSVEKTERGFCYSARAERKTSLVFLKSISVCPETPPEEHMLKQAKIRQKWEKWFFVWKAVFRTPPEVVSGFFFFGGGPHESYRATWRGGGFENHYSGPPPLVKFRMVRGGPEFLWAVD